MDTMTFERRTFVYPAFDCILQLGEHAGHPQGGRSHGRGGMKIRHVLYRPDLSVQLVWYPGVYLPETTKDLSRFGSWPEAFHPMAADLGYHSPTKPNQWAFGGPCDLYPDGCWYDGSGLNAEPVLDLLIREGDEAMWQRLEGYHTEMLEYFATHTEEEE